MQLKLLRRESCSDTKHVDPTEENAIKACLSVPRANPIPAENVVHMAIDQVNNIQPVGDNEWSDIPVVSEPGINHRHALMIITKHVPDCKIFNIRECNYIPFC